MKKLLAAALVAICIICLGLAVACAPKYYAFNFEHIDGIVYVSDVMDGAQVKDGYTVKFTLKIDTDSVNIEGGEPRVTANGNTVTPDGEGVYSVTVKSATKVTVANAVSMYKVEFRKEVRYTDGSDGSYAPYIEDGVFYSSDDINVDEATAVRYGTKIKFTVRPSVYCAPTNADEGIIVLANSTIIVPDANGVYTIDVNGNTTVQVRGLQQDAGFIERGDGNGTPANPYKISRAIDLFNMAAFINDEYFLPSSFQTAYYEMTADIDLQGERLFIIGDRVASASAIFAGNFNGNGHTIKNYYITDYVIDQENYVELDTPYIGVFGVAYATLYSQPAIYNLNLENFTINVNAVGMTDIEGEETGCCVGGLVGSGVGAVITGCSVSGSIDVVADDSYMTHVGGIIGMQTSAYDSAARYLSAVRSCSSSVDVSGRSGLVYTAGGITGYLVSAEERTAAFILNSYSTGDVLGAVYSGGIAGMLSPYGSIGNCYNTGYVEAHCRQDLVVGYEQFAYAYAGGIAGYADTDTVIYNCFAAEEEPYAYSVNGVKYAKAHGIACSEDKGGKTFVETRNAIVNLNNVVAGTGLYNKDFFVNTLKWNEGDWSFGGNGYPEINRAADPNAHNNSTVTINFGSRTVGGQANVSFGIDDAYIPMSFWNIRSGGVAEFLEADNGLRTYGYYFDAALTQKVPYGFVPTFDITLYAGFADYSQVTGTYYLQLDLRGSGAYIELKADGELFYRYGALTYTSYYTYDGDSVLLYYCPAMAVDGDYYAGRAIVQNGEMTIINWASSGLAGAYTQSNPLIAVKEISGFIYGVYYAADGTVYEFRSDRTVTIGSNTYTYGVSGNTVSISNGTTATLSNGAITSVGGTAVTALDMFAGTWEKSAASHRQYEFDGKGNWTYEYFGYNGGEKVTIDSASGTYSYNGNRTQISFTHGGKAITVKYDADGEFLIIGNGTDTQTYYREYSYAGTWRFFNSSEPIDIGLGGINREGYGHATATYGTVVYDLTYGVGDDESKEIVLYYADVVFGSLSYSASDGTLWGDIYSHRYGAMYSEVFEVLFDRKDLGVTFCLYDDMRGIWVSEYAGIEFIEFNGLGSYDLKSDVTHSSVSGSIKINGIQAGAYTLENSTLTGSFVYGLVEYKISYNEQTGKIDVTRADDGKNFTLQERDGWYETELTDGVNVYKFDGRGGLPSGGTMTVTDGNGVKTTYTYKVNGAGVTISGAAVGSIVPGPDDWTLTLNGTKSLSVNNGFEGEWFVGGNYGEALYLTIGKTGRSYTATGTFDGEPVSFAYDAENKYLRFTAADGETYYLKSVGVVLQLGVSPKAYVTLCIPKGGEDDYLGVYRAADGSYVTMDGLGGTEYGTGLATVFNGNGDVYTEFYYSIENGVPVFTDIRTRAKYRFVKGADGKFAVDGSLDKYSIVKADVFYGRFTVDGNDKTVTYTFDGLGAVKLSDEEKKLGYLSERNGEGTVVASNGKTYTYKQLSYLDGVYTLLLTDKSGAEYEAKFVFDEFDKEAQVSRYVMTLTAKTAG